MSKAPVKFAGIRPAGILQRQAPSSSRAVLKRELPPGPAVIAPENDLARTLKEITTVKAAAVGIADAATMIKVDLTSIDVSALFGPGEAGLRKAQKLIDESKFREALDTLNDLLRDVPSLAEASYLAALCEFRLDEHKGALKRLHCLSDPSMEIRKKALQSEVRSAVQPILEKAVLGFVIRNSIAELIAASKEWVDIDPSCGLFAFYYVTALLAGSKPELARKAVDASILQCDDNYTKVLMRLRADIDDADLEQRLSAARAAYRSFKYSKARRVMDKMPQTYRSAPLWNTLRDYLEHLGGGFFLRGREPSAVKPQGTRQQIDKMYRFLIAEDIEAVNHLLAMRSPEQARDVALFAVRRAPYYSYANYLAAATIYTTVRSAWSGEDLDFDNLLDSLTKGRNYASIAAADPSLSDAASLCTAFDQALEIFRAIKKEIEARVADAQELAALEQEFTGIFQLAGDGITSLAHLKQIRRRLEALESRMQNAQPRMHTPHGRDHLQAMLDAVTQNLSQVSQLELEMRESEDVDAIGAELGAILEPLKNGVQSAKQQAQASRQIAQLQKKASSVRKRIKTEKNRDILNQLIKAIDARASELRAIESEMVESDLMQPVIQLFNGMMEGFKNRSFDRDVAASCLEMIQKQIREVRPRVASAEAQNALDKMEGVVDRYLDQIRLV